MPPLLARAFGPCLSLVEFRCLGPCVVTSFAPKSQHSPIGICQELPALCLVYILWITPLHFSPSRFRDCNEFRPSVKKTSRSKVMTRSGIQDCVVLKVVKNLFNFLCSEILRCFSAFLLQVLRSSQVCSNRRLNCCSSEADNEALTQYLREARFIRYAHMPNTDSIKTTLTLLAPAYIRTFKDLTPVPVQTYTFAYCFPEVSQVSTQCLSEMNHTYKCSVNSLY